MSNHTDFDALRAHPEVDLRFVREGQAIPPSDLIILPGSKNTRGDLAWLREQGWPAAIARHLRYGGKLIGVCGGFQMLGTQVSDPHGVEGSAGTAEGLGLLALTTTMTQQKRLSQASGVCAFDGSAARVEGYEIHMGASQGAALEAPAFLVDGQPEGACSADGQILGTYLHGLFDHPDACAALLRWAGAQTLHRVDTVALREASLDRLADTTQPLLERLRSLPAP